MQPMMGMPGMQMGVPQQMANMQQMAMAPMAMGTPMGMMPAMGMMPMGVPMMPMGMMGMNPMMMMQGQMPNQMPGAAEMADLASRGPQAQAQVTSVSGALDQMAQRMVQEEANAAAAAAFPVQKAASSSSRRPRVEEEDSDEEARGIKALRNVGSAATSAREAKKSSDADQEKKGGNAEAGSAAGSAASDASEKKRCHLHMKHNPSCKVCRRIKEENASLDDKASEQSSKPVTKERRREEDRDEGAKKDRDKDEAKNWTFKSSPMLKDQILKSSYFKSLLDITTVEGLIEEIHEYADNLHVYNIGSATVPSCFICQVYRLFTLPHAEDELQIVLYSESAVVRCVGFLYVRLVFEPAQFWGILEEHLFDDMEVKYQDPSSKATSMSIGEYVEALLIKEKYFGTPLPRIPVKVRQQLEERLAPLPSYRKRMQANRRAFNKDRASDTPVEVCVDSGKWLPGTVVELFGRSSTFVKVRVKMEDGREITTHLGKVVLSGSSAEDSGSEGSGDERKKKRRSRSRRRGRSPDWCRWKGKSHSEMIEELRERAREDAVCGHGKAYPRRPLTFEGFATKYEASEHRPVDRDAQPSYAQPRQSAQKHEEAGEDDITRRLRAKQEDERNRQQRAIFEKYGKQSRPDAAAAYSDVDKLDVLRLG